MNRPRWRIAAGLLAASWLGACTEPKLDDTTLASDVRRELGKDEDLRGAEIAVASHDAVVVLTGQVLSEEQREQAEDIAESVSGVRDVDNRLDVAGTPAAPPGVGAPPPGR
jgi:hypothetical protein